VLHAPGQGDRHDRGQALRDRGDGERHRGGEQDEDLEVVDAEAEQQHERGHGEDAARQQRAEAADLALQRCGQLLDLVDHRADAPDLGVAPVAVTTPTPRPLATRLPE
jgi:hypothetical protein